MITFHPDFVAIKRYPGYFWNIKEQHLYSIKSGGLKKMKVIPPSRWVNGFGDYWRISHQGINRYLSKQYLVKTFNKEENYELPY
jgi:hypothetical protein